MRPRLAAGFALLLLATLASGAAVCAESASVARDRHSLVLLVSLDGYRWDAIDADRSPNLARLAADGVRARSLIPVFPTKTFPNHYSIVTGLYPDEHGIVSNRFYDPGMDRVFVYRDPEITSDPRWWGGEPIWNTAVRQGLRAATMFWPGSNVAIGGLRPQDRVPYDSRMSHERRLAQVLEWVDRPAAERPALITLYLSDVDSAGHATGPDSVRTRDAIRRVDATLGALARALDERGLADLVELVVVSDHGMAASSPRRVIVLDDHLDLDAVHVVEWDPVLALWPDPDKIEDVVRGLTGAHPHLRVYRRSELPEGLHFSAGDRIPPVVGLADEGWRITTRRYLERHPERFAGGTHGYDPEVKSMHGIFVARGPSFRRGVTVDSFRNVHVYPLLAHLLDIEPAPHSGSLEVVAPMLRSASGPHDPGATSEPVGEARGTRR